MEAADDIHNIDDDRDAFAVRSDRLLIVEGDFDWGFLRALLDRRGRTGVQIGIIGGKKRYAARVLARILTDTTDRLRWLGLARDADQEGENPLASMIDAMTRISAAKPRFVAPTDPWRRFDSGAGCSATLFVFPPDEPSGDIEKWIWPSLGGTAAAECVEQYVDCLREREHALPREWKTRVYAYLAATARPDRLLTAATRAGELPIDSPIFDRLIDEIPSDAEFAAEAVPQAPSV